MTYAPAQQPIAWQAIEDAIHTWIAGVTGVNVAWANQHAVTPPFPLVTLAKLTGFIPLSGEVGVVRTKANQPEVRMIRVLNTAGATYTVTIEGAPYSYVKQGGDTVMMIRDALLGLVQASPPSGVVALASSTDAFTLTGPSGTPVDTTVNIASLQMSVTQEVLRYGYSEIGTFTLEAQAEVSVASGAQATYQNAASILERVIGSRHSEQWRAALTSAGLVLLEFDGPTDISYLEAEPHSRFVATFTFQLCSETIEDVATIEIVDLATANELYP